MVRLGRIALLTRGLPAKVIAAHFTGSPKIQQLIRQEKIEPYCFPGGVVQQLLREIGLAGPACLPIRAWELLSIPVTTGPLQELQPGSQ